MLALLAYVLLDELVHTAQLLLLPCGASTLTAIIDVLVTVGDSRSSSHVPRATTPAFTLTALTLT